MSGRIRTVGAVVRFTVADLLAGQRVLVPLIVHAAVLGVLFGGDPGPLPVPWAASALALYPVAAWAALVVANGVDPEQRPVTTVAAGGPGPVVVGTALVAFACGLVAATLSVAWPVAAMAIRGGAVPSPAVLVLGAVAHLATAATGTAVGLVCARPFVARVGWSFCVAATVVVITVVQPWLPPTGSAANALLTAAAPPYGSAALALALLAAATVGTWLLQRRA